MDKLVNQKLKVKVINNDIMEPMNIQIKHMELADETNRVAIRILVAYQNEQVERNDIMEDKRHFQLALKVVVIIRDRVKDVTVEVQSNVVRMVVERVVINVVQPEDITLMVVVELHIVLEPIFVVMVQPDDFMELQVT